MPNWTETNFRSNSGEDHLGILSVGVNIAESLMAGINTVTPRARYRSFYCWVLYDFLNHSTDKSRVAFKNHLRRREMAYILANLLSLGDGESSYGIVGSTKGERILREEIKTINVDQSYVKNEYGGYAVYRGSMVTMHLVKDADVPGFSDVILPKGVALAKAFIASIRNSEYYQNHLNSDQISRKVLIEYGKLAGLSRIDVKSEGLVLSDVFFRPDLIQKRKEVHRRESLAYFLEIIEGKPDFNWGSRRSNKAWRKVLFECRFPDEALHEFSMELTYAQKGWQIYQLRQYFSYALETIFCFLIEKLHNRSASLHELLHTAVDASGVEIEGLILEYDSEMSLQEFVDTLPEISLEDGVAIVQESKLSEINHASHVMVPIIMLTEIFRQITIIESDPYSKQFLLAGRENHLSMDKFFRDFTYLIGKKSKVSDLGFMIISEYLVHQHHRIAIEKLLSYNLDTFRMLENEGVYEFRNTYRPNFNLFRGYQALTILTDLGLLIRENGKYTVTSSGKKMMGEVKRLARNVKDREWGGFEDEQS